MDVLKAQKNVLIISEPGLDGVFRHVEGLIYFLLESEWRVHFAYSSRRTSDRLYKLVDVVHDAGCRVLDLGVGNAPEAKDWGAWRKLRELVKEEKPLVVHGHSSKGGALARLGLGAPSIYTPNAYYGMGYRQGMMTPVFNAVERFLGPRGLTIHVSPEETEFARERLKLPAENMVEIPNAVDFRVFRPAEDEAAKRELRSALGVPENSWVIGSIGRVCYQKHPELLYEATSALANAHADFSFCLLHVGGGESADLARLERMARTFPSNLKLVRPVYRSDPEVFYQAMDAFCLSSRYEGLPFTGLEALAANLPLILTDGPGLRSFGDSKYAFNRVHYGKVADRVALTAALEAWFEGRDTPCNHRMNAEAHFSIPEVYRRIASLYLKVAGAAI